MNNLDDYTKEIFTANTSLPEDEVVMAMVKGDESGKLGIRGAQVAYRKLAIESGLVKTPKQRRAEFLDSIENIDISTEEGYTQAKDLSSSADITSVTATKYIRAHAKELGITLPTIKTSNKWDVTVSKFTKEELEGATKEEIETYLIELGYAEKSVGSTYNRLRTALGFEAPVSMSTTLVEWYIEQVKAGAETDNDSIKIAAKEIGMTGTSPGYYVGVFAIVKKVLDKVAQG